MALGVVLVLLSSWAVQAQTAEWHSVVSDEVYFIAQFPSRPTLTEGDISGGFGKGYSRRWTLETTDVFYEVSVNDFPDLSIEMDYKPLNLFYDQICDDLASQYGAKFDYYTDILFDEYGRTAGRRTKEFAVSVRIYLVRQRLYQVKTVRRNSLGNDKQTSEDIKHFMKQFIFVHRKENEKQYSLGLPETVSQGLRRRKN
ncbi:MAG TPA: hypothetical protein VMM38_12090 [Aridibacter sp.]|nr:hypothetical protein [Aridibacter sp.]